MLKDNFKNFNLNFEIKKILLYLLPILIIFSNALTDLILALLVFIYIFEKKFKFNLELFEYFLLAFFVFPIISTIINFEIDSFVKSILYLRFFIFYLLFKDFLIKNNANYIKYLFVIFILISFDLLIQYFFYYDIFGFPKGEHRLSGFFNEEFIVATYLLLLFLFIFELVKRNVLFEFIFINIAFIIFLIIGERIIFFTFSSIIICYYFFNKFIFTFLYISFLSILFILIISFFNLSYFFNEFLYRYYDFFDHITSYNNSIYYKLFLSSVNLIRENFLFGVGFDQFFNNCNLILENYSLKDEIFCSNHSHNYYLEIFSETGFFAFVNFLILICIIIYKLFKKYSFKSIYLFYFLFYIFPIKTYSSIYSQTDGLFFIITLSFIVFKFKSAKSIIS